MIWSGIVEKDDRMFGKSWCISISIIHQLLWSFIDKERYNLSSKSEKKQYISFKRTIQMLKEDFFVSLSFKCIIWILLNKLEYERLNE